jgi:hypothetical protein
MAVNLRGLFAKFSSDLATVTTLSVGTVPVVASASNPNRLSVTIYNVTGTLYVKKGVGVSVSNFTHRLTANTELTVGSEYTGPITIVKQSGTTDVNVTVV